jgi:hypothetical protein
MTALNKWLTYYRPLFRGRFDFFQSAGGPMREGWHQGLGMTGGRFWSRVHGGHDLRRRDSDAEDANGGGDEVDSTSGLPKSAGLLVGRADGRAATVATFPWINHQAGQSYTYELFAVGAGGVAAMENAPTLRLSFDDNGALVGPEPNPVCGLAVDALSGGRFRLRWAYDETNEEAPPSTFDIFNDADTPGSINDAIVVASVPYRFRQGFFSWLSAGFAHDAHPCWSVRAVTAGGAASRMSATADGTAMAAAPLAPAGVRVGGP